jgi:hypothetical protein
MSLDGKWKKNIMVKNGSKLSSNLICCKVVHACNFGSHHVFKAFIIYITKYV